MEPSADRGKANERGSRQWRAYALAAGAAAVTLAVLIALVESGGDGGEGGSTPSPTSVRTAPAPLQPHVLGDASAPVTLLEYSDYG